MIRAVLDSSVLVSAFLKSDGVSAALLARARAGSFLLCLSRELVAETAASLLKSACRLDDCQARRLVVHSLSEVVEQAQR